MERGPIRLGHWLTKLFAWDTLLPAGSFLIPRAIGLMFPNNRGPLEVLGVAFIVTAFFLRLCGIRITFTAGQNHFDSGER